MCTSDAVTASNSPSVARIWSITCEPCAPSQPPPCAASVHQSGSSASRSASTGTCSTNSASRGSPIAPSCTDARKQRLAGVETELGAEQVHDTGPLRRGEQRRALRPASRANGFSHSTCFPAATASSTSARVGVRRRRDRHRVGARTRECFGERCARMGTLEPPALASRSCPGRGRRARARRSRPRAAPARG